MAGIIYYGTPNNEAALERAAKHLGTTASELAKDLRFIRFEGKVIMDDIRNLLGVISLKNDGYAVLFDRADILSPVCQNALLKALEDRDDILFLFISRDKGLLPTVESRSKVIRDTGMGLERFCEVYPNLCTSFFFLSGGDKEVLDGLLMDKGLCLLVDEANSDVIAFLSEKQKLLKRFGFMKEKDASNFFEIHRELVPGLYAMLTHLLMGRIGEKEVIKKLDVLETHKEWLKRSNSYGKNDFFDLLIKI